MIYCPHRGITTDNKDHLCSECRDKWNRLDDKIFAATGTRPENYPMPDSIIEAMNIALYNDARPFEKDDDWIPDEIDSERML